MNICYLKPLFPYWVMVLINWGIQVYKYIGKSNQIPEILKYLYEYLLFKTSVSLLGYGTNRACWECISLTREKTSKLFLLEKGLYFRTLGP